MTAGIGSSPPRDLTDGLSGYRKWMDGCFIEGIGNLYQHSFIAFHEKGPFLKTWQYGGEGAETQVHLSFKSFQKFPHFNLFESTWLGLSFWWTENLSRAYPAPLNDSWDRLQSLQEPKLSWFELSWYRKWMDERMIRFKHYKILGWIDTLKKAT